MLTDVRVFEPKVRRTAMTVSEGLGFHSELKSMQTSRDYLRSTLLTSLMSDV